MPSKKTAENGHSWTISQFPITRVKAFYLERTAECSPQTTPNECLSSWMRSLDGYAQRMSTLRVLARSLPSCSSRIPPRPFYPQPTRGQPVRRKLQPGDVLH